MNHLMLNLVAMNLFDHKTFPVGVRTLQETNISPFKGTFESMIFLFPWDKVVPG